MPIFGTYKKKIPDWSREAFIRYLKLGTWNKVKQSFEEDGTLTNLDRLKVHNRDSIAKHAWTYALYNMKESYDFLLQYGYSVTPLYWEHKLVRKAYDSLKSDFPEWLKENEIYDKYKDYKGGYTDSIYVFPTED